MSRIFVLTKKHFSTLNKNLCAETRMCNWYFSCFSNCWTGCCIQYCCFLYWNNLRGWLWRGEIWKGSREQHWMIVVIKIAFIIPLIPSLVCVLYDVENLFLLQTKKKCASVINSKSFRDRYRVLRKHNKSQGLEDSFFFWKGKQKQMEDCCAIN